MHNVRIRLKGDENGSGIVRQLKGEGEEDEVEVPAVLEIARTKVPSGSPSAKTCLLAVWALVDLPVPVSPFDQKTGDPLKSPAHDPIPWHSGQSPAYPGGSLCNLRVSGGKVNGRTKPT